MLPKDILHRFKVREICEIIGSGIQPLQNLTVLKQFEESKQKDWAAKWISKGLSGNEAGTVWKIIAKNVLVKTMN